MMGQSNRASMLNRRWRLVSHLRRSSYFPVCRALTRWLSCAAPAALERNIETPVHLSMNYANAQTQGSGN